MPQFLPCLLERWERWAEADGSRGLRSNWDDVRKDVHRNLEWLLNTEVRDWYGRHRDGFEADGLPKQRRLLPAEVASSVLAFGVPAFAGQVQSKMRGEEVARELARRILSFEPRIHEQSLEVHPVVDENPARGNLLRFSVQGYLRANPLQAFDVMTELDLETGQARVTGG
jgi:type VI secretion system lysozyme-like protein